MNVSYIKLGSSRSGVQNPDKFQKRVNHFTKLLTVSAVWRFREAQFLDYVGTVRFSFIGTFD